MQPSVTGPLLEVLRSMGCDCDVEMDVIPVEVLGVMLYVRVQIVHGATCWLASYARRVAHAPYN